MKTYFALFLVSAGASLTMTPLLRRLCERFHLLDEPRGKRKLHQKAVPRLGGVAIFLSLGIALSILPLVNNLLTQTLRPQLRGIIVFLICGSIVLLLGVYDDLRGANAWVKFTGLAGATILFYLLGGRIGGLSIPFVGNVALHPALGFLLTLVWVVALVLTGALAGFLRYNFNPASIFLGDSGSLFVGFALAALSVQGSQKASTAVAVAIPILAFGLPVVDTCVAIARRFLNRKPIFEGDREHIHHMLLERGWSQRRVALVLYGVSALFGLLAMMFVNSGSSLTAVVLFVVGVAVVLALGKLRYHEVDELRASVKRNIGERRARAGNNLRLRKACQAVSSALTLDELFDGVLEVLELGEFVYAAAQLSCNGHLGVNERAVALAEENGSMRYATISAGRIHWTWKHSDFRGVDVAGSDRFWAMHLPLGSERGTLGDLNLYRQFDADALLFDVNYLTTVFQPALARAAERIFAAAAQSAPRQ